MQEGILFCTPCYGGMVFEPHFQACLQLTYDMQQSGIEHTWLTGRNESLVHRARMEMTATFLRESDFTHMMWIDADIEFTTDDVGKLWNHSVEGGAGIVVAAYPMKKPGAKYAAWVDGALVDDLDQFDGPVEVDLAGTGFMMIKREVLERIYQSVQQTQDAAAAVMRKLDTGLLDEKEMQLLRDAVVPHYAPDYEGPDGRVPALYKTPINNDTLLSEDYFFCKLARKHGFKILMDPSIRLGHWGIYRYGDA